MVVHDVVDPAILPVLIAALLVLGVFWAFYHVHQTFRGAGFTRGEALAVLLVAPVLGLVNVPVFWWAGTTIAVNLGAFLVPVVVAVRLLATGRVPVVRTVVATALVAAATYLASGVVPGRGVVVFMVVPLVVTVLVALAFSLGAFRRSAALAYASGTLGVLVGADLVRLPALVGREAFLAIGGAGSRDAILVVGILAVVLHLALYWVLQARR